MIIHTPIQIRWGDIDQLRHVYNGQYQHYFDLGKSDYFFQRLGITHDWANSGDGFLTAQTLNNYYSSIEMHEQIEAVTSIEKIGNKSFTMFQQLINRTTSQVKADSRSVIVCFNPIDKQTISIPEKWRTIMVQDLLIDN